MNRRSVAVSLVPLALVALTAGLLGCDVGAQSQRQNVAGQGVAGQGVAGQAGQQPVPALPQVTVGAALPAPTLAPTATPQPTAVPTAVPTSTPHPLSIAALRSGDYPGSEITVEQVLPPGGAYSRQMVSYRSEGLKIQALLLVPRGQRPAGGWPVVVFNHGFIPPQQYYATNFYVNYVDAFARNGYLVFMPDYRGHGRSEGRPSGAYGSPDYVVDVMNALASIRRYPEADPDRVGMWGHSMGGYITLRALVATDAVKAGVIWAGVVDSYQGMLYSWGNRNPNPPPTSTAGPGQAAGTQPGGWRNRFIQEFGPPEENPGMWASVSANTYVMDLTAPVQIHHGTADATVPLRMSQTLEGQIRQAGRPVELHVYPGDDHNISRNLGLALGRSVAFFNTHVKGS